MNQKRVNGDWVPASMFGYTIIHGKHPKVGETRKLFNF